MIGTAVIIADVNQSNGVIHVVDSVLLPSNKAVVPEGTPASAGPLFPLPQPAG